MVVDISPGIAVEHIICARAADVFTVGCEQRTLETESVVRDPAGEIILVVEYVFRKVACRAFAVGPADVIEIVDAVVVIGCYFPVGIRPVVSQRVVVSCLGRTVFASFQFIPFVIGNAVAVRVVAYHHYTGFRRTTFFIRIRQFVEAVPPYAEIRLTGHVDNRVVESESHITAVASERDHYVVGTRYRLFGFLQNVGI